ncbi:histone-like nucleoid-structuring protein Lsr2 [Streptomyces malaysiensis]|nr:Lsr2 family protein [Streptomyces malaysiensis]
MAQKVQVQLIDDMDGGVADETLSFSLDGRHYEIDLRSETAQEIRDFLAPFARNARRAGTANLAAKGAKSRAGKIDNNQVREWAKREGLPVSELGRLPKEYAPAFEEARRGDRTRLNRLLRKAQIDPEERQPSAEPDQKVVPLRATESSSAEDSATAQAKVIGDRLSAAQETRLRAAYDAEDRRGVAANAADNASYKALVKRGCMKETGDKEYEITGVGRAWIKLKDDVQRSA